MGTGYGVEVIAFFYGIGCVGSGGGDFEGFANG